MPRAGPKKVGRYGLEFKLTAVRLSEQPGIQVKAVAAAIDIHPFILSRWRKQVRDGEVLFRSRQDILASIATQVDRFTVTRLCDLYGVTRAGYCPWQRRVESAHSEQDRNLTEHITRLFHARHGRYGSPRIHRELAKRLSCEPASCRAPDARGQNLSSEPGAAPVLWTASTPRWPPESGAARPLLLTRISICNRST